MSLGKKTLRDLKCVLASMANGHAVHPDSAHELLQAVTSELKPKRSVVASHKRIRAKKAERLDEWGQIREKVLARADGRCENPYCARPVGDNERLECDHQFGGSSRKTLQSVYTVRALCSGCHWAKTRNTPDAAHWQKSFIEHCWVMANACNDAGAEAEANGYAHAAMIAQARLDSLETMAKIPDWSALHKGATPFKRDLEIGGVRDQEIAALQRAGNMDTRARNKRRRTE